VTQVFSEEGSEFDAALAQGFMPDHDAAPVQQSLDVPVAQWEAVIELLWACWMIIGKQWQ